MTHLLSLLKHSATMLALFSGVLIGSSAGAAQSVSQGKVAYASCPSGKLEVRLNAGGRASKHDLLRALQLLGAYPSLEVAPFKTEKHWSASFTVALAQGELASCAASQITDSDCAEQAGWSNLQRGLGHLHGIAIRCMPSAAKADTMPRRSQSQGEVTGSN